MAKDALRSYVETYLEKGTSLSGKVFEHFIILEILRLSRYLKKDYEFSFYRTLDGAESKEIFAIAIKASSNPDSTMLSGLRSFKDI